MEGNLGWIGLVVWIGVWVLIVNFRRGMGLLTANVFGCCVGLVISLIVLTMVVPKPPPPTPEERAAQAVARDIQAREEHAAKLKRAAEAVEAEKLKDRSVMAAIICSNFVEASLKAPKSADFPFDRKAGGVRQYADQTYQVRSYVDAQNSFGAELRNWYNCQIQYKAGSDSDPRSWRLISLEFEK